MYLNFPIEGKKLQRDNKRESLKRKDKGFWQVRYVIDGSFKGSLGFKSQVPRPFILAEMSSTLKIFGKLAG